MKKQILYMAVIALLATAITSVPALAGDLDDGISKFTDGSISKEDELGQIDHNIKFIKMNAKSKAAMSTNGVVSQGGVVGPGGSGNMNSVIVGPGSNFRGDIIIIDESKGDKTQVVD